MTQVTAGPWLCRTEAQCASGFHCGVAGRASGGRKARGEFQTSPHSDTGHCLLFHTVDVCVRVHGRKDSAEKPLAELREHQECQDFGGHVSYPDGLLHAQVT